MPSEEKEINDSAAPCSVVLFANVINNYKVFTLPNTGPQAGSFFLLLPLQTVPPTRWLGLTHPVNLQVTQ